MQTAPTDSLDAHSNLLPFNLLVKRMLHWAATQLASLPESHLLTAHVNKAAQRYVKRHWALLHKSLHTFRIVLGDLEDIKPIRRGAKLMPKIKNYILVNRSKHLRRQQGLQEQPRSIPMDCALTEKWGKLQCCSSREKRSV